MSNPAPLPHVPAPQPERRRTPAAARGPYLTAVRLAWQTARDAGDARHPALALALVTFARDGHARGAPVETLLRALDTVVRPDDGSRVLDFADVREWAGTQLIRGYYAVGRVD